MGAYNKLCINRPTHVSETSSTLTEQREISKVISQTSQYLFLQARVVTESAIHALQNLGNVVRISAGEAAGDDITVHDHHLYMVPREPQLLQQVVTAT
jgi:hypothetical protein